MVVLPIERDLLREEQGKRGPHRKRNKTNTKKVKR